MKTVSSIEGPVIPNGQTESSSVDISFCESFTLYAPAQLTGTINIQSSPNNVNWYNLQDGGADINIGVDDAVTVTKNSVKYIRLKSTLAEAAEREFKLTYLEDL